MSERDPLDELLPIRLLYIEGAYQSGATALNFAGIPSSVDTDTGILTVELAEATSLADGLMSAADKARFDAMTASDDTPVVVEGEAGSAGIRDTYSRSDHQHGISAAYSTLLQLVDDAHTGYQDLVEYTAPDTLVLRTASDEIGCFTLYTKNVKRKTAGDLTLDGKQGILCAEDGNNICRFDRPSADNATLTSSQATFAIVANGASGAIKFSDGSADWWSLSYPSSIAQLEGKATVSRILNANSSGQIVLRTSASNGFVAVDSATVGFRDYGANYDYIYFLNKWTGLPSPGDAISIHGYLFPDLNGNAPNGQIRWYGKQKIWQELTCQDLSGTGATSKRILDRMARLTSSTAAFKDVTTITAASLPSGDYVARVTVDWIAASVTEAAGAGGRLHATIERFGGVTTVLTPAADQIIGVQDNGTASIDTATDTPRIAASSGDIIVRIEVTNTDDVRLAARVFDLWVVEH